MWERVWVRIRVGSGVGRMSVRASVGGERGGCW